MLNCESEPIHIPGTIQPHGFLLALLPDDVLTIAVCSANTEAFLGKAPAAILNQSFAAVFGEGVYHSFRQYLQQSMLDAAHPFVTEYEGISYNTSVHKSGSHWVLELEPFPDGSMALPDLYNQTRKFVALMNGTDSLIGLCQSIADETRMITGYDRVMIYRFDKDYNGEVIAESRREDLIPFLGQHYPHTDIPAQARELYLRNLLRMIVDVDYQPVPLFVPDTNADAGPQTLDLSVSVLRSVSPIHIEYLKNMGVQATLTISLVQNGRLWGLIACHHYSTKNLPHYTRLAAQLQGHFLTSQIDVREVEEEYRVTQTAEGHLQALLRQLTDSEGDIHPDFFKLPSLLDMVRADGVVAIYQDKIYAHGTVLPEADIVALSKWLSANAKTGTLQTNRLADIYPDATREGFPVAGMLYFALEQSRHECIIWFRAEVEKTILWAGNPEKAVMKDEAGMRLTPRKSFEKWKEVVRNQSQEWSRSEINTAASLAHALQKQFHLSHLRHEEERYRLLSEKLKSANEELSNINWIGTHDLKEPLRKIRIFGSKVLSEDAEALPASIKDAVGRMQGAATRMQALLDDILLYSRTSQGEASFETVDMNKVLDEVLSDLSEEIAEKNATIEASDLPGFPMIVFQVRQLLINLIGNALKFTSEKVTPVIRLSAQQVSGREIPDGLADDAGDYYRISIADNGIGFSNDYAERIFKVFQRLHTSSTYSGTGIGLAICRKVMENHHGFITAEGAEGKGATFQLYFPV